MTRPSRRSMRVMWKLHRFWYRVSGGRSIGLRQVLRDTSRSSSSRTERIEDQAASRRQEPCSLTYLACDPRGYRRDRIERRRSTATPAWWTEPAESVPDRLAVATSRQDVTVDVRMRPRRSDDEREQSAEESSRGAASSRDYATRTAGRRSEARPSRSSCSSKGRRPVVLLEVIPAPGASRSVRGAPRRARVRSTTPGSRRAPAANHRPGSRVRPPRSRSRRAVRSPTPRARIRP